MGIIVKKMEISTFTYFCSIVKFSEKIIQSCNKVFNPINFNLSSIYDLPYCEFLSEWGEVTNISIQDGNIVMPLNEGFTEII